MGGRGRNKKGMNEARAFASHPRASMTLREESLGRKNGNVNAKTMCKLDHLRSIAVWAVTDASVPSIGAFLGERLAATSEALGVRADPSLFVCERCESILQPGSNCTVRIEKNKSKRRHKHKKSNLTTQNNVFYSCHFCSRRNLMRGTPKGYVKEICLPKDKPPLKLETFDSEINKLDAVDLPTIDGQNLQTSCPETPLPTTLMSLLDSKRRKRNRSGAKKVVERETSSAAGDEEKSKHGSTSKRRKKSWTSLKEIAQGGGNDIG